MLWVTVLVAAGAATLGGATLATLLLVAIPAFFTSAEVINYQTAAFGVAAIVFAQAPNGLIGMITGLPRKAFLVRWATEGAPRVAARRARMAERLVATR
jgi:hypothetical protein